jgi:hypothetical protein
MRTVAVLALSALAAASPVRASWVDQPLTHVVLASGVPGSARDFIQSVEAAGGHVAVVRPPYAALVHADEAVLGHPDVAPWIARADVGTIDLASLGDASAETMRSARIWNAQLAIREETAARRGAHAHPEPGREMLPDARHVPVELPPVPERRDAPDHIPYGAQYYDTSTFLAGTTAVGVWLLEAAGATYDWTQAEEDQTLAGVQSGLAWWVTHGGAMASLTFVVETHTGVPVSGVPIENPQSWETVWIGEALANAGWPGADAYERCFAYNNSIRDLYETNWCYSYFIVDSDPAVNQGLFSGGGYAWAYYGGPWVWMSRFSSWAYNAANYYEAVPEHEMGHIFYATDEYDGFQQWSGYLNKADTPGTIVTCLMNQNVEHTVCSPSRRQLAWMDGGDGNGVMAPLDPAPSADLDELLPDPTSDFTPTWTGRAAVNTLDNLNPNDWRYSPPHDVTIAEIAAVECRVDGGAWTAATATDGTFDAYGEDFSWTSPPLADGVHLVEARARTQFGIWTTVFDSDEISVTGSPVAAPLVAGVGHGLRVAPNPARGDVALSWRAPAGPVQVTVFDAAGRRVFDRSAADAEGSLAWDGRGAAGTPLGAGVYLVRLQAPGLSESRRLVMLR